MLGQEFFVITLEDALVKTLLDLFFELNILCPVSKLCMLDFKVGLLATRLIGEYEMVDIFFNLKPSIV